MPEREIVNGLVGGLSGLAMSILAAVGYSSRITKLEKDKIDIAFCEQRFYQAQKLHDERQVASLHRHQELMNEIRRIHERLEDLRNV